ncbi:MAG: glycosyltransferase family 9 protein [Phycisphaerales bacterium]|nr:glycosyltransferase family 9 protein [Phycisphaerales bacterium]
MGDRPLRLLIVLPSWVGDVVMATPAIRRIREAMPGIFIGALCRPGIDQLISSQGEGSDLFDEVHVFVPHGMMATKKAAAKVRPRRYDTALLLTNSFSTALTTRIAFIPRRIGYERDGRGMLLTDKVVPPRNDDRSWQMVPAVDYYWNLAAHLLGEPGVDWSVHEPVDCVEMPLTLPDGVVMELPVSDADQTKCDEILAKAGIGDGERFAVLNPGGNNEKKRWPAERFARLADWLHDEHGMRVLLNGSPAESELIETIRSESSSDPVTGPVSLPALGNTLGALKAICERADIMVTNDTGPRHIAAAMGTKLVTMFGPTDPRWTTVPVRTLADGRGSEVVLVADPELPAHETANDHPERCAIERIEESRVRDAVSFLLNANFGD